MPASVSSPRCARCGHSRRCGKRSPLQRYGINDPKQRLFRYGVQVNSLGLTEPQPENNVYRIFLEMLAVTLIEQEGARPRSVQLPAWNEALGLPRPFDQQWSLRAAADSSPIEIGPAGIRRHLRRVSTEIASQGRGELKQHGEVRRTRDASNGIGGAVAASRDAAYMKQRAGREQHSGGWRRSKPPSRHRGRGKQIHRERALAADRRPSNAIMTVSHDSVEAVARSRGSMRGAPRATVQGGRMRRLRSLSPGRGKADRECHAGLDRLRQGRRHDGRMGRGVPRSVFGEYRAPTGVAQSRPPGRRRPIWNRSAPRGRAQSRTSSDGA